MAHVFGEIPGRDLLAANGGEGGVGAIKAGEVCAEGIVEGSGNRVEMFAVRENGDGVFGEVDAGTPAGGWVPVDLELTHDVEEYSATGVRVESCRKCVSVAVRVMKRLVGKVLT